MARYWHCITLQIALIHRHCLSSLIGIVLLPLNKVYAMPKTIIRTLIEENSEFSAYFFANIADKLKNQSDNRRENELAGFIHYQSA